MSFLSRNDIVALVDLRLGHARSAVTTANQHWDADTILLGLKSALALAEPLGQEVEFVMSHAGYIADPQAITAAGVTLDVIAIRKVEVFTSASVPARIDDEELTLYRGDTRWLRLRNEPGTSDTLRIHAINAVAYPAAGATVIPLDPELLVSYTMGSLYQSLVDYAPASQTMNAERWMLYWMDRGDRRKARLETMQYRPIDTPAMLTPPKGSS